MTLERMETDGSERSLTYIYGIDYATIDAQTSDLAKLKKGSLESCEDFKDWLSGPVKKVIVIWRANDGTKARIEILPSDCGY